MTLARRMTLKTIGLAVSLSVLGVVTTWGLATARRSTQVAREEYLELRLVLAVDEHLLTVRQAIVAGEGTQRIRQEFEAARVHVGEFQRFQIAQKRGKSLHEEDEDQLLTALDRDLRTALHDLAQHGDARGTAASSALPMLQEAQAHLKQLATETGSRIEEAQSASDQTIRTMAATLGIATALIILVTVLLNIVQYRRIVVPLGRLAAGARRIASGRFDERVDETREGEFAQVAKDFNQMASRLDELYGTLEQRVQEKSRELVRSERLASVGYLAAGVAHEINNPLGIITGYAEITLKRLQKVSRTDQSTDVEEALRIIREEAFRCKEITDKLLSLATGRELVRQRVRLDHILDDVVSILGGLHQYRDRKIVVRVRGRDHLEVMGNETELRQVVLNLAINALEACLPKAGEVRFDGRKRNGVVELVVSDNGRGMTADVVEHVFEPFFTQRRHGGSRGTGLGLSITHAIVEAHGGRIRAESDGPCTGSRFYIELPAAGEPEPE